MAIRTSKGAEGLVGLLALSSQRMEIAVSEPFKFNNTIPMNLTERQIKATNAKMLITENVDYSFMIGNGKFL